MKKYKVSLMEIHRQDIIIEAESEEQAIEKAKDGDGEYQDCVYVGTTNSEPKVELIDYLENGI